MSLNCINCIAWLDSSAVSKVVSQLLWSIRLECLVISGARGYEEVWVLHEGPEFVFLCIMGKGCSNYIV